jgi:hypothetical protein
MRGIGIPFTASAIERVRACPASAIMPQVIESGEDAARGTSLHRFTTRVLRGDTVAAALAEVPEEAWRATARRVDFRSIAGHLDPKSLRCEIGYAANVETGGVRCLGEVEARNYPAHDNTEIVGTEDLEGRTPLTGQIETADLKFGHAGATAAEHNPQIAFFARSLAMIHEAPRVGGSVLHVDEHGHVHVDRHVFEWIDLDAFGYELADTVTAVERAEETLAAGDTPDVRPGPWCRYCGAAPACPAHTALARAMLSELEAVDARVLSMTREEGGQALLKAERAQAILDRVKSGLKVLERNVGPLPVAPGKEWRPIVVRQTRFDRDGALALLRESGVSEDRIAALTLQAPREEFRVVNARG